MFSFGMEPSITRMKGAPSSPRAAARNGARYSSPPTVGESTLLCRCTLGSPGITPVTTSSIDGWLDAVIDTVSPSQLMPSEIQRMCTSSKPCVVGVVAVARSVIAGPSLGRRWLGGVARGCGSRAGPALQAVAEPVVDRCDGRRRRERGGLVGCVRMRPGRGPLLAAADLLAESRQRLLVARGPQAGHELVLLLAHVLGDDGPELPHQLVLPLVTRSAPVEFEQ